MAEKNPIHKMQSTYSEHSEYSPKFPYRKDIFGVSHLDVRDSLDFTNYIIEECGPRLGGTKSCHKAAKLLKTEMDYYFDDVKTEEFKVHPESFLGFTKIMAISYLLSTVFILIGQTGIYIAVLSLLIASLVALSQFVFYWKMFDFFYKTQKGINVVGRVYPEGEIRQKIILSGHHDSAFEFNFLKKPNQKWYSPRLILGMGFFVLANIGSLIWMIDRLSTGVEPIYANIIRVIVLLGLIFTIPFYFFIGKKGTPGAGDNLISTSMAIKIGKIFAEEKLHGVPLLKHTELIILSSDCEEAGLRGARSFCKTHKKELQSVPTYDFNLDSIYDLEHLQFMINDINGTIKLSKKMATECIDIAENLGYSSKFMLIPFGGGGTDAAEFAKIGVEATTLVSMSSELNRDGIVYHTDEDTVDNIEPEAVEACLRILLKYILRKEREISS